MREECGVSAVTTQRIPFIKLHFYCEGFMKTIKTITQLMIPIFLGLIIGGAVAGNSAVWICGLVFLIIDIIVGISIQYSLERRKQDLIEGDYSTSNGTWPDLEVESDALANDMYAYMRKVEDIMNSPSATAYFTPKEIVYGIVNLIDARNALTPEEYELVNRIFNKYSSINKRTLFHHDEFISYTKRMIAEFDLVAPYYKYSGNFDMQFEKMIDFLKADFRTKARKLIDENNIFSVEWKQLCDNFYEIFYKDR